MNDLTFVETKIDGIDTHLKALNINSPEKELVINNNLDIISNKLDTIDKKLDIINNKLYGGNIKFEASIFDNMNEVELREEKGFLTKMRDTLMMKESSFIAEKQVFLAEKDVQLLREKKILLAEAIKLQECLDKKTVIVEAERCIEVSASKIAKSFRYLYSIFGLPLECDTFIPNKRIRKLLSIVLSIDNRIGPNEVLHHRFGGLTTLQFPPSGSEKTILDRNGSIILNLLATRINDIDAAHPVTLSKAVLPFKTILASNRSEPEPFIAYEKFTLFGSELKSIEHSNLVAVPQLIHLCCDSCINLYNQSGLDYSDCVVPGLIVCGDNMYQFYAVYLVSDSFPVIVKLSRPLVFRMNEDLLLLCKWIEALAHFILDTINLIRQSSSAKRDLKQKISLKYGSMFFKPIVTSNPFNGPFISDSPSKLVRMMTIYKSLWDSEVSREYVLFPIGLMTVSSVSKPSLLSSNVSSNVSSSPVKLELSSADKKQKIKQNSSKLSSNEQQAIDYPFDAEIQEKVIQSIRKIDQFSNIDFTQFIPVIIFDYLRTTDGWTVGIPSTQELRREYLKHLWLSIKALNRSQVVHLDLRPSNIMWRKSSSDGIFSMKLIDFEDARKFGERYTIPDINDSRYPYNIDKFEICDESSVIYYLTTSEAHNNWFFIAISCWLTSIDEKIVEGDVSYDKYMREETKFNYKNVMTKWNTYSDTFENIDIDHFIKNFTMVTESQSKTTTNKRNKRGGKHK